MKVTMIKATDNTDKVRCGEPIRTGSNWITEFLRVNYDKNLAYVMKSRKFKAEAEKYELVTVNYDPRHQCRGVKKMLFLGNVCMYQEFTGKRGGAREGAGRKAKYCEKVSTVSFCAPMDIVELITRESKKEGITKSEWIVRKLSQ